MLWTKFQGGSDGSYAKYDMRDGNAMLEYIPSPGAPLLHCKHVTIQPEEALRLLLASRYMLLQSKQRLIYVHNLSVSKRVGDYLTQDEQGKPDPDREEDL